MLRAFLAMKSHKTQLPETAVCGNFSSGGIPKYLSTTACVICMAGRWCFRRKREIQQQQNRKLYIMSNLLTASCSCTVETGSSEVRVRIQARACLRFSHNSPSLCCTWGWQKLHWFQRIWFPQDFMYKIFTLNTLCFDFEYSLQYLGRAGFTQQYLDYICHSNVILWLHTKLSE